MTEEKLSGNPEYRNNDVANPDEEITVPEVGAQDDQESMEERVGNYRRRCKDNLAENISNQLSQSNPDNNRFEYGGQYAWNVDPETVQIFSDYAYDTLNSHPDRFGVLASEEDIKNGSGNIKAQVENLKRTSPYSADVEFLEKKADTVAELEEIALTSMLSWQIANEISTNLGIEKVNPEKFMFSLHQIKSKWIPSENRREHYIDQAKIYRSVTERVGDNTSSTFPEVDYRSVMREGTHEEAIVSEISGFANKLPTDLSKEDVPVIIAYYHNAVHEGIKPIEQHRLVNGVELALEHALKSDNPEDEVKGFDDLVKKMRVIQEDRRSNLYDITGNYAAMARKTGDDTLAFKLTKPEYF